MNKELARWSDEQLETEIKHRQRKLEAPEPIGLVDMDPDRVDVLRLMALRYIEGLTEDGYPPKDTKQYMFEQVMEIFYGPDVWTFVNHILR